MFDGQAQYFKRPLLLFSKVHLEISPDSQQLTSEGFNKLKVSNALRYEVLAEILTSLDISCRRTPAPPLSPVHLLAAHPVRLEPQGHRVVLWLDGVTIFIIDVDAVWARVFMPFPSLKGELGDVQTTARAGAEGGRRGAPARHLKTLQTGTITPSNLHPSCQH